MKNVFLTIGGLILIVNVLCGFLLSSYTLFNCMLSSCVIIVNVIALTVITAVKFKDAFKTSLSILFPLMGLIEFVFSLLSSESVQDNWYIIFIIIVSLLKSILLMSISFISKKNNKLTGYGNLKC